MPQPSASSSSPGPAENAASEEEDNEEEEAGEGEAPVGPSFFVAGKFLPPQEDIKVVDARQLVVHDKKAGQGDADDKEALEEDVEKIAGISAFARETKLMARGRVVHDIEEIEKSMNLVEEDEGNLLHKRQVRLHDGHGSKKEGEASSGAADDGPLCYEVLSKPHKRRDDGDAEDAEEGEEEDWGDWFDEFIVNAAKDVPVAIPEGEEEELTEELEGSEEEEEEEHNEGPSSSSKPGPSGPGSVKGGRAASIASSYWRPERQDRKGELNGIDDRFEVLATQYEDEALGELDEEEEAEKARNEGTIEDFRDMLDDFLAEQAEMEAATFVSEHEGKGKNKDEEGDEEFDEEGSVSPSDGFKMGSALPEYPGRRKKQAFDEPDQEVIQKTRERIVAVEAAAEAKRAAKEAKEAKEGPDPANGKAAEGDGAEDEETDVFDIEPRKMTQKYVEKDDRWDCESVLSLRSNLENHPARIAEPQKVSGGKGGGTIKLSSKTGMPAAYTGRQHVPSAGLLKEDAQSDEASTVSGDDEVDETASVICTERRKDETLEEKKARKASVKEAKREARASKKQLKEMFKDEGSRQKKQQAGAQASGTGGRTFFIA